MNNRLKTQSQLDFNQSAFEIDLDLFSNNEVIWTESCQVNGFNPHVHSESNSTLGQSTDQMNHLNSVNSNAHLTRWVTLMVIVTVMVETYPNIPTQSWRGRGRILVEEGSSYARNPKNFFAQASSIRNVTVTLLHKCCIYILTF